MIDTMEKTKRLSICNHLLLVITILMLASSIQLEITAGSIHFWVWVHVILGLLFFGLISRHLYLHFKWRNWLKVLWKQKRANTRWMTLFGILTLLTAIVATVGWLMSPAHTPLGAIHGKLGFIFIALALWHILKRMKYYRGSTPSRRHEHLSRCRPGKRHRLTFDNTRNLLK